jgi:hypothetical protein
MKSRVLFAGCAGFTLGFICGVLSLVALIVWFTSADGASLEEGAEKAKPILAALEKYKQDKGHYPEMLAHLIPLYLSEIPRPAWRYEYTYGICRNGKSYRIYFKEGGNVDDWCGYSSGVTIWKCIDSYPPYMACGDSYP